MAVVTFSVRTFGLAAFPADERLQVLFTPSGAAFTAFSAFPERVVRVSPDANGFVKADLAPTYGLQPEVWYQVSFEWDERSPDDPAWRRRGRSEVTGRLRVPESGGTLGDLLEAPAPPDTIRWGYGPPPSFLSINDTYADISGMKLEIYGAPRGRVS